MARKILLITLEYPPQKGGMSSYYEGLAQALIKKGYAVNVISQNLLYKWVWPRWLKTYFILRSAIAKEKPDILFVGQILPLGIAAYLLRKRVPYVVFAHGMDILLPQKSWRKRWIVRKILQKAKVVVANSEFTKEQIKNFGFRISDFGFLVLYPCPALMQNVASQRVESLRQKLGLAGKQILLTLGRVVERKGHDLVIKALPEILKHVPNAVYVVAGTGHDLPRLQKLAASGFIPDKSGTQGAALQPHVRFVGEVTDEDRPLYYALCDIFVMPSRQIGPDVEGFGLAYLEAAQYGKPSIGGLSGGVPEAILDGQTGILVDPQDSSALARAVVQLLRDDVLREELGKNAKARVLHEFNWERKIEKLIPLL